MPALRQLPTTDLTPEERRRLRGLLDRAFSAEGEDERFTDEDWEHALGGTHFVVEDGGGIVAHASVVERELQVGGRALRTGYVEAVATAPEHQGRGFGTRLMEAVNAHIQRRYELGALGTGRHAFYERLGWRTWRGPSGVRTAKGEERTPDEDGFLLVLRTPATPPLDDQAPITCVWRPGDVW